MCLIRSPCSSARLNPFKIKGSKAKRFMISFFLEQSLPFNFCFYFKRCSTGQPVYAGWTTQRIMSILMRILRIFCVFICVFYAYFCVFFPYFAYFNSYFVYSFAYLFAYFMNNFFAHSAYSAYFQPIFFVLFCISCVFCIF